MPGTNLSEELSKLLNSDAIAQLEGQKNLLAFSAGVDSTALFFLLKENKIDFDIAIVDYAKREASKAEVFCAQKLAAAHHKRCFSTEIFLEDANFEKNARIARYQFFEEIIQEEQYQNLITAHQLNDRLEWFLMQFTKGAGTVELLGFETIDTRENYSLIRPLINTSKASLLAYLHKNEISYFEDESNSDPKYKRNQIRHHYADALLKAYEDGITKSFNYLDADKKRLFSLKIIVQIEALYLLQKSDSESENIRAIDKVIKKLGYILSAGEREEILRQKESVISHQFAVCISEDKIFIAPFVKAVMDKTFKESCRVLKIPPKIRGYLWQKGINPQALKNAE